ncbi:23S rRNA (adenine(1618)-N(6))-methyltransferase RlmF [Halobacteriovorax sp. JY17]|uniref:23S rRNA (adenine(1618)-N(6))-methyltransferase RlmF n=1 Tax=Halobacteriovorax sp. JY17 TaxID=2014617 RepID=UPI000C3654A2|nr:23S rRNA (adenine(1618)-N(6))-methyltransferase RlmF [Halobacteriovorax sp. JY17]PIK15212.1 MAG: 23S rRNA (adenine(1618)-N(6))-methyltransferase [Halobacteriovorax sp. JY17]
MKNEKSKGLHPRSHHNEKYDFSELIKCTPDLERFVSTKPSGELSINFSKPEAINLLNKSLLHHYYGVEKWNVPKGHLCPPIPGRADYLHIIADLLSSTNSDEIPIGEKVKGLDIGVGATCIYPLIGNRTYGWKFVGSDIDSESVNSSKSIVKANKNIKMGAIKVRFQTEQEHIFDNMIQSGEKFDFTMCNPPFHSSLEEAELSAQTKIKNLEKSAKKNGIEVKTNSKNKVSSNFGGNQNELVFPGGEIEFIRKMIKQSAQKKPNVLWFTTLVSKEAHLDTIYQLLKDSKVEEYRTLPMQHGNKEGRIVAWTFQNDQQKASWAKKWEK